MINFPSRTKFILHFEQAVSVSQSDVMPQAFEFRIFSRREKKKFGNYILHTYLCPFSLSFPFYLCTNFFSLTESHRLARVISTFEIACRCSTTWYPLIIYFTQKLNRVSSKQFLLILLKMYRFYWELTFEIISNFLPDKFNIV